MNLTNGRNWMLMQRKQKTWLRSTSLGLVLTRKEENSTKERSSSDTITLLLIIMSTMSPCLFYIKILCEETLFISQLNVDMEIFSTNTILPYLTHIRLQHV
uniref:Uncharacterized protein n=1 Tax=Cacopsylla melanoneura TaxID=428564 RepID=A0A8D9FBZ8_9HEMI